MTITVVFDPPLPSDSPATFNTKAFSTLGDLNDWSTEANALAGTVNSDASTASTGASTATTQAGIATTQAGNAATSAGTATTQAGIATAAAASVNAIEATTHAATSKTTPVDADEIPMSDSAASWGLKKLTWANLKATLATWIGGGTIAGSFTTLAATGNATLGDAEATDTHAIKGATTVLANSASPALKVTQTGAGNAFVVEDSASTDSTPFVIDANGRVVAGHTASVAVLGVDAGIQSWGSFGYTSQGRFTADQFGSVLSLVKSRNAAVGGQTVVQNGDEVGILTFLGSDGTGFIRSAQITASVDGTPGTNDMPGRLVFSTTADGAASPTERMRIDSSGNVLVTAPAGLGYGTGAGGTVTQSTSKSTAVTLNKPTGQITMNSAALAANTVVSFALNNSLITTSDLVLVCFRYTGQAGGSYQVFIDSISLGTCSITLKNLTAGSLSDGVVISFAIIKGATS